MESFSHDQKAAKPHAAHNTNQHQKPSTSELLSSAKVVAGAAKAQLKKEEFDKAKAAGAAADILNAASHYGKLEEGKGFGKVVDKAEDYLHKYSTSHTTTTTTTTNSSGHSTSTTTTTHETTQSSTHPGGKHGQSGGGYGEYIKMAEGMFNKHSGDTSKPSKPGHDQSGSGYGEYMKMAGDFLKKH